MTFVEALQHLVKLDNTQWVRPSTWRGSFALTYNNTQDAEHGFTVIGQISASPLVTLTAEEFGTEWEFVTPDSFWEE